MGVSPRCLHPGFVEGWRRFPVICCCNGDVEDDEGDADDDCGDGGRDHVTSMVMSPRTQDSWKHG